MGLTPMAPIWFCNHPDRRKSDGNGPLVPQRTAPENRDKAGTSDVWQTEFYRIPLECTRDDVEKRPAEKPVHPMTRPTLKFVPTEVADAP